MADLPKRRPLLGKKLLVVVGMSAISQLDCSSSTVANLIVPPQDAGEVTDAQADRPNPSDVVTPRDDGTVLRDVPVANLLPPPDVTQPVDVPAPTDTGVTMRDVPVANLIPPPEDVPAPVDVVTPTDTGVMLRDIPVANLIPPPPDSGR
jgi:hypothetical protein